MVRPAGKAESAPNVLTVGDALLRYLTLEGVDTIFGIPGGGLAQILVILKNAGAKFRFIVCRQETGAVYIADGYYRATGKLSVVMVTSGPGATNALTGTVNAENGGSAMLVVTGEVMEQFFGKGYLQEGTDTGLDIDAIYSASTALSAMITNPNNFQTLFEQALRDAMSIPRRAVHISIPNDIPPQPITFPATPVMPKAAASYRATPQGAPRDQVYQALQLLLGCSRPLIFLGSGCREALRNKETRTALTEFVERYAIPVMTTADGKGVFPESHELSLRNYGFASCSWPSQWMAPAGEPAYDGLLVIGSALLGLATNNWNPIMVPQGPLIQVDIDQHVIGRSLYVSLGVVGEAGAFIRLMNELAADFPPNEQQVCNRRKIVADIRQSSPFMYPTEYASEASPIEPAAVVRVLQEMLPRNSMVMLDAGNCVSWGINCFVVDYPMEIHSALAMGPMGFGVGAVVGAKMGRPDATCVGFVGDGAFMMHGAEVSTAAQYKVGAIWVVLSDNDLHMVTQGQEYFFPDAKDPDVWERLYSLGNPDLALFAQGLGADAYTITSPAEMKQIMPQVLEKANLLNRPQVVIAKINRKAFSPYFPPKSSLEAE